jgi:hypothetical protein
VSAVPAEGLGVELAALELDVVWVEHAAQRRRQLPDRECHDSLLSLSRLRANG